MSTLDHIWPSDINKSLWNYEALHQPRNIPFMGETLSPEFYIAYATGAAIIFIFALQRFNMHSDDIKKLDVKVLQKLKPMELRAGALMFQAYLRYVGVLMVIYTGLTMSGSLIFDAFNQIPTAVGLQVDTKNLDYESPQWPLYLGLGIAGFVPMLRPVEVVEKRLRAWAHQTAGIPIRVTQQTNRIKKSLDGLTGPAPEYDLAPDWLAEIATETEQRRAFKTRAQLRQLYEWSKDQRAYWPKAKTRNLLKEIEDKEARSAFLTLEAFDDLLHESYHQNSNFQVATPAASPSTSNVEGSAKISRDGQSIQNVVSRKDALIRHQRRLEREWNNLNASMEESRDELASMLAIFVEHDNRTDEIVNPQLKRVVSEVSNQQITEDGPTFWLFLCLIPVFATYWFAIKNGNHSMLSNFEPTTSAITLSVLMNTAKIAIQFCIPVYLVLSWRHVRRDIDDSWELIDITCMNRSMTRQLLGACAIAAFASIILLALLALIWVVTISRTNEQFELLYFFGSPGYLSYFSLQFSISVVITALTLVAVDFVQIYKPRTFLQLLPFGFVNVALVLFLWAAHINIFLGFDFCIDDGTAITVMTEMLLSGPQSLCYQVYEGTDLYIYTLLAFCSACYFIPLGPQQVSFLTLCRHLLRSIKSQFNLLFKNFNSLFFVIFMIASLQPVSTQAQTLDNKNKEVRLGFRSDVQPFSYFDKNEQRYRGYLVDLCLRIFSGRTDETGQSGYTVIPVPIEVNTRFNAFKQIPTEPEIDILCDPVTIAFQPLSTTFKDDTGRDGGVFSPIVFASGVSYLARRPSLSDGNFILSWVKGATADKVAKYACKSDLFKVSRKEKSFCDLKDHIGKEWESCNAAELEAAKTDQPGERKYFFCTFESHEEAIEWFCDTNTDVDRAYFGDRDIIVGKLGGRDDSSGCSRVEDVNETYTYEPYALVINKNRPDLIRFVQRRIYEIFSNRDEIAGIFSSNFKGRKMTPTLANLFLLNAVEFNE